MTSELLKNESFSRRSLPQVSNSNLHSCVPKEQRIYFGFQLLSIRSYWRIFKWIKLLWSYIKLKKTELRKCYNYLVGEFTAHFACRNSSHVRESKKVLDYGFHTVLDSGSFVTIPIISGLPDSKSQDSIFTSKNCSDLKQKISRIPDSLHETNCKNNKKMNWK